MIQNETEQVEKTSPCGILFMVLIVLIPAILEVL
jgi:hypothetical protein